MDREAINQLTAALGKPFPKSAIKQRKGGGGMYDYVETETVIRRLNDCTPEWSFRIVQFESKGDLFLAVGELTIPGLGTRSGIGVQVVKPNSGEDLTKGAGSDALKKAATLFGVALELYGPDLEAAAQNVSAPTRPQPTEPAKPRPPQPTAEISPTPTRQADDSPIPVVDWTALKVWIRDEGMTRQGVLAMLKVESLSELAADKGLDTAALKKVILTARDGTPPPVKPAEAIEGELVEAGS